MLGTSTFRKISSLVAALVAVFLMAVPAFANHTPSHNGGNNQNEGQDPPDKKGDKDPDKGDKGKDEKGDGNGNGNGNGGGGNGNGNGNDNPPEDPPGNGNGNGSGSGNGNGSGSGNGNGNGNGNPPEDPPGNGNGNGGKGKGKGKGGGEGEADAKVTICHATGTVENPYSELTISVNGLNGHGHHENDIIPMPAGGCPTELDAAEGDNKVTICHATNSEENPYEILTLPESALSGHGQHEGDIIPMPVGGCPAVEVPDDPATVAICHATGLAEDPYEIIVVPEDGLAGHGHHENDIIPLPADGCPVTLELAPEVKAGTVTICHATGNPDDPFEIVSVPENALDGHGTHKNDIIPMPVGGCPAVAGIVVEPDLGPPQLGPPDLDTDDGAPGDDSSVDAAPEPEKRSPTEVEVFGATLPFTGASLTGFLVAALGLIVSGLAALKLRHT